MMFLGRGFELVIEVTHAYSYSYTIKTCMAVYTCVQPQHLVKTMSKKLNVRQRGRAWFKAKQFFDVRTGSINAIPNSG